MLSLKKIVKQYAAGDQTVAALKCVSLDFRKNEFVSILGPSGCGKTTLLNIIGGLDQYTSGDLIINGKSTKNFSDRDWDTYRNYSIGFVFQSYNLIPHQSVLANVELALTLSGVSKAERRRRAEDALRQVGLGDQLHKKPNQMSGGQMQRVAIARALVNNPDILLADEPTGALDSETSVQVMELLKEISKDRLIIMVTHNPELAQHYSTRIIRLLDGQIVNDSNPCTEEELAQSAVVAADTKAVHHAKKEKKRTSMSFFTALSLSTNNLMTKKARTLLTSFAGSIGIIGIALILSVSSGVQLYINQVQEDTLSSYPIQIEAETVDYSSMISSMMNAKEESAEHEKDAVYSNSIMYQMANSFNSASASKNNLAAFKKYLDTPNNKIQQLSNAVQYSYHVDLNIYTQDKDGAVAKADVNDLFSMMYGSASSFYSSYSKVNMWEELLPGTDGDPTSALLDQQYDVIYGSWPQAYNEIVVVLNSNNEISDMGLYALGLKSKSEMSDIIQASLSGEQISTDVQSWSYDEICAHTVRLVLSSDYWQLGADGTYTDLTKSEAGLDYLYENGLELKIVGIVRPNPDASAAMINGSIGYTSALTNYIITQTEKSASVAAQRSDESTDIFTGLPFATEVDRNLTDMEKAARIRDYFASLNSSEKAAIYTELAGTPSEETLNNMIQQTLGTSTRAELEAQLLASATQSTGMSADKLQQYFSAMDDNTFMEYVRKSLAEQLTKQYAASVQQQLAMMTPDQQAAALDTSLAAYTDAQLAALYAQYSDRIVSAATLDQNLEELGCVDPNSPSAVNLYAATFESKDAIADEIKAYNSGKEEKDQITYTDYVALLMSSITTILNAISYVLIAFVAISLVVSSIMIGIITYISVLERTKEIGILRAIGASKRDIARVFNAEALIIGFTAGAIGIGITLLLNVLINVILHQLTGIASLNATLPAAGAGILVAISMFLTFIAGLIPSRIAARKDPVVALRSE